MKRPSIAELGILFVTACLTLVVMTLPVGACDIRCGDSDGSCNVTVVDASHQLRKAVGLDKEIHLGTDDTTGNGYVSVLDALYTLRRAAGLGSDFQYELDRCPKEMVILTASVEAWHALALVVSAEGRLVPSQAAADTVRRELSCHTDFSDLYFEYALNEHGEASAAFATAGTVPMFLPESTEILRCLVYPPWQDDGWDRFIDSSTAYFWPVDGHPTEVPLALVHDLEPAMSPWW